MLSIRLRDHTNLPSIQKKIEEAAKKGVEAAVQESVEWIKDDVIRGQSYVGHQYYPDVTDATKRMKAKKGKTRILIDTSNYLSSWDGKARNMEGIIHGGGQDYHADLYKRGWKIDLLWQQEHSKVAKKIIEKAVEKAI